MDWLFGSWTYWCSICASCGFDRRCIIKYCIIIYYRSWSVVAFSFCTAGVVRLVWFVVVRGGIARGESELFGHCIVRILNRIDMDIPSLDDFVGDVLYTQASGEGLIPL